MASTVLPNGIIIPEKYSRDWYSDLYHNWQELDNLLGGGTPKDGTLTIQKNGSTVGTFSANQATDETIDITVPDVNNGTLTIQQNGTTVDSFSANSSTDKTVNIQCVDLTSNQTVPGNKEFTGTTTAHDVVPSATDTYNFGSPSYQWNNAYIKSLTINGVACGDILTHNVSEFVDVTSAQSVGGQKIFTHSATGLGKDLYHFATNPYGKNTPPANDSYQYMFFSGNTASQGFTNSWYGGYLEQVMLTDGSARGRWSVRNTNEQRASVEISATMNNIFSFRPTANNVMLLGLPNQAWKDCCTKAINGLNPGALSLPGNYINVDTTNWVLDGSGANSFIPASDGWFGIQATDTVYDQMHYVFIGRNEGDSAYHPQNLISPINALWYRKYHGCVFIPVIKGVNYDIRCICGNIAAKFYPCQGNV